MKSNTPARRTASATRPAARSASRHGRPTGDNTPLRLKAERRDVPLPSVEAPPTSGPARRGCRMSRRTLALADLKLRQIEDAFLDTLLDAHPRRVTALDRLLNDIATASPARATAAAAESLPQADPAVAAASTRRIESTLVAAVIDRHPRRDRALDRLLNDLGVIASTATAPDAAHGAWVDEADEACRVAHDEAAFDTDFDGLG